MMNRDFYRVTMVWLIMAAVCPKPTFAFCFDRAGNLYGIPPQLIEAIAYQESAFDPVAIHHNANGSFDYGLMQINSWWFETLGLERWQALSDPCFNVMVGTWILADCIDRHGYTWDCLSCYRSGKPLNALQDTARADVINYIQLVKDYFERLVFSSRTLTQKEDTDG